MKKFKTRPVSPTQERAYWSRFEECWALAMNAAQERKWTGCCINIIHSLIALADLVCIRFVGKRYAGTSHDEAVDFYAALPLQDEEFKKSIHRLGQIVATKTDAEYGGNPANENDVAHLLKSAERFKDYALLKLGKK